MSHSNQRSLQQWLQQHMSPDGKAMRRHAKDYEKWNVKRPSEDAKKLIRAVLVRLYKVHVAGEFHGALSDPRNYIISRVHRMPRDWEYEIVFRDVKEGRFEGPLADGQAHDTLAVMNIIFGAILPDEVASYSPDIQNLYQSLADGDTDKIVLANHPSVWGWRERFFFFFKVMTWSKFGCRRSLAKEFSFVTRDYTSWKSQLQSGTPLHKVLKDRSCAYGDTLVDLVRFIRNVFEHITEFNVSQVGQNKYKYVDDSPSSPWFGEKFVENEITKLFPLLLVDLYLSLYESNIIILD